MATFEVYVDNIGKVSTLDDKHEAIKLGREYFNKALRGEGRADPHVVVLDTDGEIVIEFGQSAED